MEEKKSQFTMVNTAELSKVLGVSKLTIFKWRRQGLPYYEHGKCIRYELNEIFKYMKGKTNGKTRANKKN
jgi:phage terminase Nu1 subunit (DNA packaging protein)